MEIVSEDDDYILAGDYTRISEISEGNNWGSNITYALSAINNPEPVDLRFIGRSYDNDIRHTAPWHWFSGTNYSWYGVTDKTKWPPEIYQGFQTYKDLSIQNGTSIVQMSYIFYYDGGGYQARLWVFSSERLLTI